MSRLSAAFAALLLLAAPVSAYAQAYQCRPPQRISSQAPATRPPGEQVIRVATGGYVLALSWSPEYCRTRGKQPDAATQCDGRTGSFGFILHGLWPQGQGGRDPQYCRTVPPVSPAVLRQNLCTTPSVRLMNHEWARHGSCMTGTAERYFRAGRILFKALEFPDMDRLSRSGATAGALREAMVIANPELDPSMIGISTNRRGWVEEVRLCLDRRFRPRRCSPRNMGSGNGDKVQIWRGGETIRR